MFGTKKEKCDGVKNDEFNLEDAKDLNKENYEEPKRLRGGRPKNIYISIWFAMRTNG